MRAFLLVFLIALPACVSKASTLLREAEKKWMQNEYREAVKGFVQVIDGYPGTPEAETALLRAGETFMLNLAEYQKAVEYFTRVVVEYPKGERVLTAQEAMASIYENSLKDYNRAVIQYQKLLDTGPAERLEDYQLAIGRSYYLKGDYEQAIIEYQTVIEQYPDGDLVPQAEYQIANSYFVMNRCEPAVKQFDLLLENRPDVSFRSDILLSIGVCMEEREEYAYALQLYEEILNKYGNRELIQRKIDAVLARMRAKNR